MVLSVLVAASVATTALASDGRLLRFPTTNGTDIVFSYAGDLYTAPLAGGQTFVADLPRSKAATPKEGIDLKGLYADIDWHQEWAQIFDEAWRAFRDGFYLENMHGIDWPAMKAKYEVLLPYVQCRLDLNYVIGEMIGELTVGHSYVSPGEYKKPQRIQTGLLGAEIVPAKNGSWTRPSRFC